MQALLLPRCKELDGSDKHKRAVFAHGEINVERPDRGTTELHAQDGQAIKRPAELVRIVMKAIDNRA